MKRTGNLWSGLTSWRNLTESAHAAARGKRARPDVARFLQDLEPNICALQARLAGRRLATRSLPNLLDSRSEGTADLRRSVS